MLIVSVLLLQNLPLFSFMSVCLSACISLAAATANLLHEIIMVRDNFLTLPGWFTRDDINNISVSICVS